MIKYLKNRILGLEQQKQYLKLSAKLLKFRLENPNAEDPDEILDAMDSPWYNMNMWARSQVEKKLAKAMKNKDEEIKFIDKYL